jgi:hypothetical protein
MTNQKTKNLKFCAILSVLTLFAASSQAQIAKWTFETSQPANTPGAGIWVTNVSAEIGSGTASALHTGNAAYTSPSGNGSAHSFSANTWATGDLYQFASSTVGFANILVSYDQVSSATGPGKFNFSYSTDGVTFTTVATDYTVLVNTSPNAWSSSTPIATTTYTYDLSSVTALNNVSAVWFRIIDDSTVSAGGGTVATAGTDRVDNFTIAVVPEPNSLFLVGGLGLLAASFIRRRK